MRRAAFSLEAVGSLGIAGAIAIVLLAAGRTAAAAPIKVVVLGASTAAGKNLDWDPGCPGSSPAAPCADAAWVAANSWAGLFSTYLSTAAPGSTVVDLAVPGYATCKGLPTGSTAGSCTPDAARNVTAALALNPDALILSYPGNDVGSGYGVDEAIANQQAIVAAAAAAGVPAWVATSQPNNAATAAQLAQLIDQRNRTLSTFAPRALDFWSPIATPSGGLASAYSLYQNFHPTDQTHPNAAGHRLLYQQVLAADIPGALAPPPVDLPPARPKNLKMQ